MDTERIICEKQLQNYRNYLQEQERSENTITKYMADIARLADFAAGRVLTKKLLCEYKDSLLERGYEPRSINSYLVAANGFFKYMEWYELSIRLLRIQQETYIEERKELDREEYVRLVRTAQRRGNLRLCMILNTLCATGIRISELRFLTTAAVRRGKMRVNNKGKIRTVLIPSDLQHMLTLYIRRQKIENGVVFRTAKGNPVNRSNVWREMKALCAEAKVDSHKVFPHNLRALFARLFYAVDRDMAKLANLLGHRSIDTTRLYLRTSDREYQEHLQRMRAVIKVIKI